MRPRRDRDGEIVAPIRAEIQIGVFAPDGNGAHGAFNRLEAADMALCLIGMANLVEGVPPDSALRLPGLSPDRQHLRDLGTVVPETVYPRHTAPQDFTLDPGSRFVMQVRQLSVVAIDPSDAVGQGHGLVQGEREQCRFRLIGQRPGLEIPASERELRRLDTHEADFAPVMQDQRIAIDDFDDFAASGRRQLICRRRQSQDQDKDDKERVETMHLLPFAIGDGAV